VDVALVIRQRLEHLGLGQRDLANAAQVTESYVSQLLTGKKSPPAPNRTDIYDKMEQLLRLPDGELARMADLQRAEESKRRLGDSPTPLFKEVRQLILRKCIPEKEEQVRAIFEKQPFGELERLVTQKLMDVVKGVAKQELENESWLRTVALLSSLSYEQMRVTTLEFLEADVLNLSVENCTVFLDPLLDSWDIDLATFSLEITLNQGIAPGKPKRFEFVETKPEEAYEKEPGFAAFLQDASLRGDATRIEIEFLAKLKFAEKRPNPLYYYRELQNLRDPLHFRDA
jgi:transcriptional regulator with XRE-family HTH domain